MTSQRVVIEVPEVLALREQIKVLEDLLKESKSHSWHCDEDNSMQCICHVKKITHYFNNKPVSDEKNKPSHEMIPSGFTREEWEEFKNRGSENE